MMCESKSDVRRGYTILVNRVMGLALGQVVQESEISNGTGN